ncbi:hypothetical protein V1478_008623 [Vespula squamosa]|uniref:Uncharacterized protein n=1 Tax=Vespula squamosa TaxID=30214 RepID=A0ABD2AUF5_VESSQ
MLTCEMDIIKNIQYDCKSNYHDDLELLQEFWSHYRTINIPLTIQLYRKQHDSNQHDRIILYRTININSKENI